MRPLDSVRRVGFLTPDAAPDDLLCRSFSIPNEFRWLGNFMGALLDLTEPENWQQYGTLTPDEAAAAYSTIIAAGLPGLLGECETNVQPPYWDDATDVDDELPPDEQEWYGVYDGIDGFRARLEDWAFAGFLAYAGELGAAVSFLTIAPQFRLAWRKGDIGGIIRIFIDAADQGTVDTYDPDGGVVEKVFFGDPELEEHQITMVLESLHA